MKTKKLQLLALSTALTLSVAGAAVSSLLLQPTQTASAQTYSASDLFTSANTNVSAQEEFVSLNFEDASDNSVKYNRDLAYKWYTDKGEANAKYLTFSFSFGETVNFKTFTVTFTSQENSRTSEGKAKNEIVFFSDGKVAVRNNENKDTKDEDLTSVSAVSSWAGKTVEIAFANNDEPGKYAVKVNVDGADKLNGEGAFTNIKGAFAESTSDVVPLALSATFEGSAKTQTVSVRELNGQSFQLKEGRVEDNADPVLVVNDQLKSFNLGMRLLDFEYEVIDVCDSSVTKTMKYYRYQPGETEPATWPTLTTSTKLNETYDENNAITTTYVAIKFELKDDTNEKKTYDASWYAAADARLTTIDNNTFFAVINDSEAPEYDLTVDYQDRIDQKIAADPLKAGEGYSFYLPSFADVITDSETPYENLKFTIYYRSDSNSSTSTKSSLSYNQLEIPIGTAGEYHFRVVATDKAGNEMTNFHDKDDNSDILKVTSSNVWDVKEEELPTYTFRVNNRGITIEESKQQSTAYVGTKYTVSSFTVKGVSGHVDEYELYYLSGLSVNNSVSYKQLVDFANAYAKKCTDEGAKPEEFAQKLMEEYPSLSGVTLKTIAEYDSDGPQS
ncbi:MAG: hypothetical protein J6Z36_03420, partial [Clostridia bacterium]|nr:hypothetical protein [Clostridia bacterium]